MLGQPHFGYRLGSATVESPVDAWMCERCATITLAVRDPERIRRAHAADAQARSR